MSVDGLEKNLMKTERQIKVGENCLDVRELFYKHALFALAKCNVLTNPCLSICVGILLNASTSPDENDSIDVELQCDMLFIVSSLCEVDTHRKVRGSLQ